MTDMTIVPTGYAGDDTDYLKVKRDPSGAVRNVHGTVTVPSGTAADAYVGLVPFQKGATFTLNDKSIYCADFGAGTTTVNIGIVYDDNVTFTDDPDAFASASTAPQSGGFVTLDETTGMTIETQGNGWLAAQLKTAAADADGDITFNALVAYDA